MPRKPRHSRHLSLFVGFHVQYLQKIQHKIVKQAQVLFGLGQDIVRQDIVRQDIVRRMEYRFR